jgi:Beta-lactamase
MPPPARWKLLLAGHLNARKRDVPCRHVLRSGSDARVILATARMSNDASGVGRTGSGAGRGGLRSSARRAAGTGAALAVWGEGRWLVDLWGGVGRCRGSLRLESRQHRSAVLGEQGVRRRVCVAARPTRELELDAAVQRYWPEFRARATVRQLLSHQAGVVALGAPAPTELFFDWDEMCRRLAAEPPAWEPGTAIGESALFYGHLVGELVRRADGRRIGAFLRDEVTAQLGLDFALRAVRRGPGQGCRAHRARRELPAACAGPA